MNLRFVLLGSIAAVLVASTAHAAGAPGSIEILQRSGAYELTVPASRLVLTIPRGDLALGKNTAGTVESPRYFFLEDSSQNLIITGWFEPEPGYPGLGEFWDNQLKQWREKGLPEPRAVSIARISDWDAVIYDIALPFGSNSHIRAHWVQAGTWIDLHLSITSNSTADENRKKLKSALKAIRVQHKE